MIIALTGFMGSGKSSVGRELSTLLGLPVVDLDRYIEQRSGLRIPEIFALSGEPAFRDLETAALSELLFGGSTPQNVLRTPSPPSFERSEGIIRCPAEAVCNERPGAPVWREPVRRAEGGTVLRGTSPERSFILSLGGGAILRKENAEMIREKCKCVFLRASAETLRLRLRGEQANRPLLKGGGFEALLEERTPLYTAAADIIVDTDTLTPMQIAGVIANLIS